MSRVVLQSDSRIFGGNEKWLSRVAEGLAARGHDVLVSCRPGAPVHETMRRLGIRTTHQRPGPDADFARTIGFARMLTREKPHAVLLTAFKRSFQGGWAARRARVPRVVERMGIEQPLPDRWKYRYAFRHYIDALIVNAQAIRERWLASAPWFAADEVHVIVNGVTRPSSGRAGLRAELELPEAVPLIAAAGRLEHRKGMDLLLSAFAQAGPVAHLALAGAGPDEEALRAQAEALGVADRVHWLGHRPDFAERLAGVDLFVLPSRREGMANVVLEAMAAEVLVVSADVSGARDALGAVQGRERAGWIVPVEAADALGVAMRAALAADPHEKQRLRAEMRYRVDHWFDPGRMVTEVERVLLPRVAK